MQVIVDGLLTNFQDEGKGEILLCLHGWGADNTSFESISKHFSKKYRVIRIDLPGFGKSQIPPETWHVEDYSNFIKKFLEKIGVKDIHAIVAHSFGGRVAIKLISKQILLPDKVIFMGAAGIKPDIGTKKLIYKTVAKTGRTLTRLPGLKKLQTTLRKKLYAKAGADDYLQAGPMRKIFLTTIDEDLTNEIANITKPTLLIWGEQDDQTPVQDAYVFHEKIIGSQLITISNAGHFVHTEKPNEVEKYMEKFL
ncbi:MAG: alpha/beta hydrolase [Patescibacteria group bacterium]